MYRLRRGLLIGILLGVSGCAGANHRHSGVMTPTSAERTVGPAVRRGAVDPFVAESRPTSGSTLSRYFPHFPWRTASRSQANPIAPAEKWPEQQAASRSAEASMGGGALASVPAAPERRRVSARRPSDRTTPMLPKAVVVRAFPESAPDGEMLRASAEGRSPSEPRTDEARVSSPRDNATHRVRAEIESGPEPEPEPIAATQALDWPVPPEVPSEPSPAPEPVGDKGLTAIPPAPEPGVFHPALEEPTASAPAAPEPVNVLDLAQKAESEAKVEPAPKPEPELVPKSEPEPAPATAPASVLEPLSPRPEPEPSPSPALEVKPEPVAPVVATPAPKPEPEPAVEAHAQPEAAPKPEPAPTPAPGAASDPIPAPEAVSAEAEAVTPPAPSPAPEVVEAKQGSSAQDVLGLDKPAAAVVVPDASPRRMPAVGLDRAPDRPYDAEVSPTGMVVRTAPVPAPAPEAPELALPGAVPGSRPAASHHHHHQGEKPPGGGTLRTLLGRPFRSFASLPKVEYPGAYYPSGRAPSASLPGTAPAKPRESLTGRFFRKIRSIGRDEAEEAVPAAARVPAIVPAPDQLPPEPMSATASEPEPTESPALESAPAG